MQKEKKGATRTHAETVATSQSIAVDTHARTHAHNHNNVAVSAVA